MISELLKSFGIQREVLSLTLPTCLADHGPDCTDPTHREAAVVSPVSLIDPDDLEVIDTK
jgi:hypothetical protein